MPVAPPPLSEADYEAIEAAVMETTRGRWFLAEYARRNRHADTEMLLAALARLESVIHTESALPLAGRLRSGLMEMAKAIAQTKAEIAAIKPDAAPGRIEEAKEELDSVVQATESATSDILAAAEQIQEIAWTLREQGFKPETCDFLDDQATDIYTACSFQDLTGQRTRKVIDVLRYLESRIKAMIDIWGIEPAVPAAPALSHVREGDAALLNGPAQPGQGLDQADVDLVMGPAVEAQRTAAPTAPAPEPLGLELQIVARSAGEDAAASEGIDAASAGIPIPLQPDEDLECEAELSRMPPRERADPLAPLRALSFEEKVALFS